jgi:hypothetical protein
MRPLLQTLLIDRLTPERFDAFWHELVLRQPDKIAREQTGPDRAKSVTGPETSFWSNQPWLAERFLISIPGNFWVGSKCPYSRYKKRCPGSLPRYRCCVAAAYAYARQRDSRGQGSVTPRGLLTANYVTISIPLPTCKWCLRDFVSLMTSSRLRLTLVHRATWPSRGSE